MTKKRSLQDWEPLHWDDHGQPLCQTPEEEEEIWADLARLNLLNQHTQPDPDNQPDEQPPF